MGNFMVTEFNDYPEHGIIIARLLAGYGELELDLTRALGLVIGDTDTAVRIVYRLRGELSRLEVADAVMRPKFEEKNLLDVYSEVMAATQYCRKVRNQFAHCHWISSKFRGLSFVNPENAAKARDGQISMVLNFVTISLLREQEEFFYNTVSGWQYLIEQYSPEKSDDGSAIDRPLQMPEPRRSIPGTQVPLIVASKDQ